MSSGEIRLLAQVRFEFTVKNQDGNIVNLASATSLKVYLRKPTGVTLTKTAALGTMGADGIMQYTTTALDLDVVGEWDAQAEATIGGVTYKSDIQSFEVKPNL